MLFKHLSLTVLASLHLLSSPSLVTASSTSATPQAIHEDSGDVAAHSVVGQSSSDAIRHRVRIYFVRHGDTDWSEKQIIEGQSDLPLNRRGRRHAKLMGEALKHIPFRIGYTSTLRRTWQTLDAISEANEDKIFYHIDNRIMGQDMGELTGKPYSTVDWTNSASLESNDVEPRDEFVERLDYFVASVVAEQSYISRGHREGRDVNLLVIGPGTAFIPMIRRLRKMGGESDDQLDAELPAYYPHSIIPVVTIDEVDRIPLTPLHVVDWNAADQKHIPVTMSLMRVPAPSASAE